MDDAEIVALYWARDERAISESALRYGGYCYAIASRILENREDAEESVNDAWVGAWGSIPPQKPELLSAYLGKLTRRIALKRLRGRLAGRRGGGQVALALEELDECLGGGQSADEALDARELGRLIDRFLDGLPETEMRVFVCRYWYLDPVAEIAQRFGFSQSKVKSMLFRTRGKLREQLQKEGYSI